MSKTEEADKEGNIIPSELGKAELKLNITKFKLKIKKIEEVIAAEELQLSWFQFASDEAKITLEEFVAAIERRPLDAKTNIEKAAKAKQMNKDVIDELKNKTKLVKRDFARIEKLRERYKWCEKFLFEQSPLEWQEAQKAKTTKAKNAQDEQNSEPEETTVSEDEENSLKTSPDGELPVACIQSSSNDDTLVTHSVSDITDEESSEIYFTDPSQVVFLLPELTDQILSLMNNSTKTDKTLEQNFESTVSKMKKTEEILIQQVNDMKVRVDKQTKRATMFQNNVLLHDPLKTQNKDKMLATHGEKVTEVHSCCMERALPHLSTLDKLCGIERRLTILLQETENIPRDIFHKLWQLKEIKKKNRLQQENLRLEMEKNKEKMKKCMNRAMEERKGYSGKKLMPRTIIVKKKAKVITEPEKPEEEDPLADLYTEDSD